MSYKIFESADGTHAKKQTVVMIHGFLSSQRYWKRLIPYLRNAGYTVITIDLLGFGSSRNIATDDYTYSTHLAHIEKCLADANVSLPFILVGHSMGGLLSARYTATHPQNIYKLILLHPPMYMNSEEALRTLHSSGRLYRFLLKSRYRMVGWGLLKLLPGGIANHHGRGREGSLENVILVEDNLQRLTSSYIQTLLVIGKRDRQIYLDNLKKMSVSKNVTVSVIDTNHHSPRNDTELIGDMILRFAK